MKINFQQIGTSIGGFFRGLFKSIWFYVALACLALGVGTYFYLKESTANQVEQAVTNANQGATIKTYQTREEAEAAFADRVQPIEKKAEQTRRDYQNVRNQVQQRPQSERQAAAPPLLIDTLNELDRLRSTRDEGAVSDAPVSGVGTGVSGRSSRSTAANRD